MLKTKIVTFLILFSIFVCYSQEYNNYDMELIFIFSTGKAKGSIQVDMHAPSENGPSAFAFDKEGNLYISDILNNRLSKYDNSFKFIQSYTKGLGCAARQLFISNNGEFLIYNYTTFAVDDNNGLMKILIDFENSLYKFQVSYSPTIIYIYNYVFTYLKDKTLLVFKNPGLDMKTNFQNVQVIKPGESHSIVNEITRTIVKKDVTQTFQIDMTNRIIINNKVITQDFDIYSGFLREQHTINKYTGEKHLDGFTDDYLNRINNLVYLGEDQDKNIYWRFMNSKIIIINQNGYVIGALSYDVEKTRRLPTIHPSGDIYFLDYNTEGVYLYKIIRQW